jgi:non-ribosomal peptide synthetase component F
MNMSGPGKESWLHFEGHVHFILKAAPFRLLVRAQGRKISHRELLAELDYLEHDFGFSTADLSAMFPVGETISLQLRSGSADTGFVVATAEILERQFQVHGMQLHLGFKRVDEELEDLLAELHEHGGRSGNALH